MNATSKAESEGRWGTLPLLDRLRRRFQGRSWPVLSVFIAIVALQLLVTVLSIDLMSAVRSYVTG